MIPITKANNSMSVVALARRSLPKNAMVSISSFEVVFLTYCSSHRLTLLLVAQASGACCIHSRVFGASEPERSDRTDAELLLAGT
jgi:hypothetical protein